jgi:hypothetical protein
VVDTALVTQGVVAIFGGIIIIMMAASRGEGGRRRGGKKEDIKQIEGVAKEYKMTPEQRREFGDFVEEQKAMGRRGTKNERGDFTYKELRDLAEEFLGHH